MKRSSTSSFLALAFAAIAVASYGVPGMAAELELSGAPEVPPVTTSASGRGSIMVNSDRTVSGFVMTKGVQAIAAHIHDGPAGKNGPIIIPLARKGDDTWVVPAGAKLTDEQYDAYESGNLYVNVHSAANKGGEIRGQLKP